jgi:hypothetical protein
VASSCAKQQRNSQGPHILRKITLGHLSSIKRDWTIDIASLADIAGPDMQGALQQLQRTNPYFYRNAKVNRLSFLLGVHPLMIFCHCCMVRPLDLWKDHDEFTRLVYSDAGHHKLKNCANTYKGANGHWPSPAQVFETLLGPPTTAAREHMRHCKAEAAAVAAANLQRRRLLKAAQPRQAKAPPAPVPAPTAGVLPLVAATGSPR